jgi:hypothetical protein
MMMIQAVAITQRPTAILYIGLLHLADMRQHVYFDRIAVNPEIGAQRNTTLPANHGDFLLNGMAEHPIGHHLILTTAAMILPTELHALLVGIVAVAVAFNGHLTLPMSASSQFEQRTAIATNSVFAA